MSGWSWRPGDWACCIFDASQWFNDDTGAPPFYAPARGEVLRVSETKITRFRRKTWWKFWVPREQDVSLRFAGVSPEWFRANGFRKIERADAAFTEAMRSLKPRVEA